MVAAGCGSQGDKDAIKDQVQQALDATKACRDSIIGNTFAKNKEGWPEDAEQAGCSETVAFPLDDLSVEDGAISITFAENAHEDLALETLTLRPGIFIPKGLERPKEEDLVLIWACGHSNPGEDYSTDNSAFDGLAEINAAVGANGTSIDPALLPAECALIEEPLEQAMRRLKAKEAGLSEADVAIAEQVMEGLNLSGEYKAGVAEYYANVGLWPLNEAKALGATHSSVGRYTTGIAVTNGTITVTYGEDADAAITGKSLMLQPFVNSNLDVVWRCGKARAPSGATATIPERENWDVRGDSATSENSAEGTNVPDKYLPASCRGN